MIAGFFVKEPEAQLPAQIRAMETVVGSFAFVLEVPGFKNEGDATTLFVVPGVEKRGIMVMSKVDRGGYSKDEQETYIYDLRTGLVMVN